MEDAFTEKFVCSDITLHEIENIKTSSRKDEDIKYRARLLSHLLDENMKKYEVVVWNPTMNKSLSDTNDVRICECACRYAQTHEIVFVSNDICCKNIAATTFGLNVDSVKETTNEEYKGFKEVVLSEDDMAYFYEHLNENTYGLLVNEYLIMKNSDGKVIDSYRWTGEKYDQLFRKNIQSMYFEKLKAKDVYQTCAIDSLMNCTVTAITGKAGSGKSLLALMTAMHLIEKGKYDRIVVMFNPTKTRGSSDMGFYSGDFVDKAMQNSIGQILTTKFGDRYAIDVLMQQNKLKLVSMADCRGMEISDNEILWITEGQNTSVELIKLCLSRVSSGAKVFIEGDYESQTDSYAFDGNKNGLRRIITAFKGQEEFGYVQLQNVWRSKLAELCELL